MYKVTRVHGYKGDSQKVDATRRNRANPSNERRVPLGIFGTLQKTFQPTKTIQQSKNRLTLGEEDATRRNKWSLAALKVL